MDVSAADGSSGVRERMDGHQIPAATSASVADITSGWI